jgi:hypothetical protein
MAASRSRSCCCWHYLIDRSRLPQLARTACAGTIGLIALLGFSDKQGRYDPSAQAAVNQEYNEVYDLIRRVVAARRREGHAKAQRIAFYSPLPVPVPPLAYRFRDLLDGIDVVPTPLAARDVAPMIALARAADVVVVPDSTSILKLYPFPERDHVPAFRAWIERDSRLKLVGSVKTELGSADVFAAVAPQVR